MKAEPARRGYWARLTPRRRLALALSMCVAVASVALCSLAPLRQVESRLCDLRARLVAPWRTPSDAVVVVAIDDTSLRMLEPQVGRWPWPRAVMGSIVEYCSQASAIGLDILFPERDLIFQGSDDLLAAEVARQRRVVCAAYVDPGAEPRPLPAVATDRALTDPGLARLGLTTHSALQPPYPGLLSASASLAVVTQLVDPDGTMRRYGLASRYQGRVYPSLALGLAMEAGGVGRESVRARAGNVYLPATRPVAVGADGALYLDYPGHLHRVIRAGDLLMSIRARLDGRRPAIPPEAFAGKVVLVGSTATGVQRDQVATPLAPALPGVFVHAAAVDNLLTGQALRGVPAWLVCLCVVALALLATLLPPERPGALLAVHVATAAAYFALSVALLALCRWVLPLAAPALAMLGSGLGSGLLFWRADRSERLRLEALETAKQHFTDMLVHDLKNRVAPITLALEGIEAALPSGDSVTRAYTGLARVSADRMLTEVRSLLDIRRMTVGRLQLHPTPVVLAEFLANDLAPFSSAAVQLGFTLTLQPGNPTLTVILDREIVSRVLGNLLWNAFEHGTAGTSVEVGYETGENGVCLWVANRGSTIPEDRRESIFEAYVSGGGARKRISGTGLGLTFCKLAAEAHAGRIEVTSPWPPYPDGVRVALIVPADLVPAQPDPALQRPEAGLVLGS